jgi:hypothetical protein
MCEKCVEIDAKIQRYGHLSRCITDRLTLDAIAKLIKQMQLEKTALHPEKRSKTDPFPPSAPGLFTL